MNTQTRPLAGRAALTTNFRRQGQRQPANRILLVGDNKTLRQLMTSWLVCSGYEVATAADVLAGWAAVRKNRYDLLITDHNPPGLSGVELINWLRSAQMTLPAIVLSEKLSPEELNRNQCLQAQWFQLLQFAAVLRKPFTTDEQAKTVNAALGNAGNLQPGIDGASPAQTENPFRASARPETSREDKEHPAPDEWQTGRPVVFNPA